ncbi:alpha/beta hydrolase family esterase [Nocardia sp. NPDC055321]
MIGTDDSRPADTRHSRGTNGKRSARTALRASRMLVVIAAVVTSLIVGTDSAHADSPVASPGCALPRPAAGPSLARFSAEDTTGGYIRDIPAAANTRPMPLVLDLHGNSESPALERLTTGLAELGDTRGFVTVTPQIGESLFPSWDLAEGSTFFDYMGELITHIGATVCIDERRVYATGLSMGGFAATALACRLSDRIAAVAAVAGMSRFPWCDPSRPVPLLAFHGTADPLVAYEGGLGSLIQNRGIELTQELPSIPSIAAAWAGANGCGTEPIDERIPSDIVARRFPCAGDADVALYTVVGGGHTWPGSRTSLYPSALVGPTTNSISATRIMWDFFDAHPLPERR